MHKCLVFVALLWFWPAHSQAVGGAGLSFDQSIANCEGKWFGAEAQDGKTILGYVYVDPSAGFTFEHYGNLQASDEGLLAIPTELQGKARLIHRIGSNFPATCLTDSQVTALGLPLVPETMKFYKDDRPPGEHHTSWASHYNHIGASDLALGHISKAIAAGAASPHLTFEHAFALNVVGRFDETISLLVPYLETNAITGDIIAELAYAYLMRGDYERSIEVYTRAFEHDGGNPSQRRWEFARNIAAAYDKLGDTQQRDSWFNRSERLRQAVE